MVKLYINTEHLKLFRNPCTAYQLMKRLGTVYSNAHRITKDLWNKGFIEISSTKPSKKNPNIETIIFKISNDGYKLLELIDPLTQDHDHLIDTP